MLNALYDERERSGGKFSTETDHQLRKTRRWSESSGRHRISTKSGEGLFWTYALVRKTDGYEEHLEHVYTVATCGYDLEPSEVREILWALAVAIAGDPNHSPPPPAPRPSPRTRPSLEDLRGPAAYRNARLHRLRRGLNEMLLAGRQLLSLDISMNDNSQPEVEIVETPYDPDAVAAVLLHELTMQRRYLLRRCEAPKAGDPTHKCGRFFITTRKTQRCCPEGRCAQRKRTKTFRDKL